MSNPFQEGRLLYNTGRLHGAWSAHDLLAGIEVLEAYRKSVPATRKRMWFLLLGSVLITIIFLILRSWLTHPGSAANVFSLPLVFIGILAIIVSIGMLVKLGMKKYDQDAAAVLGSLIRCIGPDLAKGTLIKVQASLRLPTDSALLVRASEKYAKGKYSECIDRFFKRDILDLECRLSDGTRLVAGMVEHTVEKVLKKKNPRGRWKTKRKCQRKIGVKVRLLLNEGRCRLTGKIIVPDGTTIRVRRHPRGALVILALRKNLSDGQALDASPLLALLSGAYRAVTMAGPNELISPGGGR